MPVKPTPQYLVEFPRFGLLDVELPEGFEDQSNFQNTCPHFELPGPDYDRTAEALLTIFIDYKHESSREFQGEHRFHAYVGSSRNGAAAMSSDDWPSVLRFVARHREQISVPDEENI